MKKIFIFLFVLILISPLVLGFEFDNVKSYNPDTKTFTINNCNFWLITCLNKGEELMTAQLTSPLNVRVPIGKGTLVGEFTFKTPGEFLDIFRGLYLEDLKNGDDWGTREKQFKYKQYKEVSVDDYKTTCQDTEDLMNGTILQECGWVKIGSHLETQFEWIPITNPDNVFIPNTEYEIGVFVDTEFGDYGDWKPEFLGVVVDEWATWTADLNVDLVTYYKLDEASGAIEDSLGNLNMTNFGAEYGATGIINKSLDFVAANTDWVLSDGVLNMSGNGGNFSVSLWFNFDSIAAFSEIYSTNVTTLGILIVDNATSDENLCMREGGPGRCATGVIKPNQWYHVVITGDGTTMKLYLNGTSVHNFTTSQVFPSEGIVFGAFNDLTQGFFDGRIDEIGVWNRVLSIEEIVQLYNGGSGITLSFGPIVTLNSPADNAVLSNTKVEYNCSATIAGVGTVVNASLFNNQSGTWARVNSTTGLSGTTEIITWNNTKSDVNGIIYNCEFCGSDSLCNFAISNRTFSIDTISPQITLQNPNGTLDFSAIGQNETLNVTFTDLNLDSCWYDYNGTNVTIDGCVSGVKNSTLFILEENNFNMTIYVNDSAGNLNSTFTKWNYTILKNSETFNTLTTEGSTETFTINVTANENPTSANLIYNGTSTSADIDSSNFPIVIISETIIIPSVDSKTNLTFLWNIISPLATVNSTVNNQTVNSIVLGNCSSFSEVLFNYTLVDEATQVKINGLSDNVSLEVAIQLYSSDKSVLILNFSTLFNQTNPNTICSNIDLFNGTDFILDSTAKYSSDPREIEYYNIRDATIDNTSSTQNITLFDILSSESTDFQITFKNSNFVVVEGALIQVNRQYVSEGIFKTVELPITDSNGQTVVHLVRNDVVYNYIVTKGGVVLGVFNNLIAFCEDETIGQCFIPLNALKGTTDTFNPDQDIGLTFSFTFNESTRDLVFTFSTNDGTVKTILLNGTKMDQIGNTSICSSLVTSSSGTLTCNIAASIGNETIITAIFINGELKIVKFFKVAQDLNLGQEGYFILLFLVISLGLMFSESKSMMIVGIILGFIGGSLLFMIKGGIIGTGGAIMWLIIQGIILLWKLNSEGQT